MTPTWQEKVNIYTILIAPPGIGKSPTQEIFLQPLSEIEEEEMKQEAEKDNAGGENREYNKKIRLLDLVGDYFFKCVNWKHLFLDDQWRPPV